MINGRKGDPSHRSADPSLRARMRVKADPSLRARPARSAQDDKPLAFFRKERREELALRPPLDLLLPRNRFTDIRICLEVDKPRNPVPLGETSDEALLVLVYAPS
jgi:hypothetical protein